MEGEGGSDLRQASPGLLISIDGCTEGDSEGCVHFVHVGYFWPSMDWGGCINSK